MIKHLYSNLEAFIWIFGLTFLFFIPAGESHFTICPLKNAGIPFCPGCGLGQSIHYLFHLDFESSIAAHPLGILALAVITVRIITLIKKSFLSIKIQQ
jgi:hypothetical protein